MISLLLVDPVYNPGNIPLNISLGQIESHFRNTGIHVEVSDFVAPECETEDLAFFLQAEVAFIQRTVEMASQASAVYITTGHGMELKPYPFYPRVLQIASQIKARSPNVPIVAGGALVNFYLSVHGLSPSLIGAGIIDNFEVGQEINVVYKLAAILGVMPQQESQVLEWRAWDWSKYPQYLSVLMKVGCPFKCDFCFEGKIYDKQNRDYKLEVMEQTISHAQHSHGLDRVMIEDGIMMSYPEFEDIVEMMGRQKGSWAAYARVDEILRRKELLAQMRESGCRSLVVGIESFDDTILQTANKRITHIQTLDALRLAADADLLIQGCFILGFPGQNLQEVSTAIDVGLGLDLDCYRWHVYQPNFSRLQDVVFGMEALTIADHPNIQINVPDACLLEMAALTCQLSYLDEHFLIRAATYMADSSPLKGVIYRPHLRMDEFADLLAEKLPPSGYPLNEDEMYNRLFSSPPTKSSK